MKNLILYLLRKTGHSYFIGYRLIFGHYKYTDGYIQYNITSHNIHTHIRCDDKMNLNTFDLSINCGQRYFADINSIVKLLTITKMAMNVEYGQLYIDFYENHIVLYVQK